MAVQYHSYEFMPLSLSDEYPKNPIDAKYPAVQNLLFLKFISLFYIF